jgi:putative SOS response-associated peptidase YedK
VTGIEAVADRHLFGGLLAHDEGSTTSPRPRSSRPSSIHAEKRMGPIRWGFVPPTAKEPRLAPINARAETLSTSPMFRDAFRRHRCLVVADGFYEWKKNDARRRTPFFIRLRSGRPFGFAGIWSMKHGEEGTRLATCALATCQPNELMAKIHDRMPVILPPGARDRWLDPTASEAELRRLLVPLRAEDLNAYEVSARVNSPRNDSPECVRPVE